MSNNTRQIWHRLDTETEKSWPAFRTYLDMGQGRTISNAYRIHASNPTAKMASGYFIQWSMDNDWLLRANAHDAFMEEVDDEEFIKASRIEQRKLAKRRTEVNNTSWEIAQEIFDKARLMLKMPITEKVIEKDGHTTIIKPVRFKFGDVAALVRVADTLCRLSTDMSTSNVAVDINDELRRISADTDIPIEVLQTEYKEITGRTPDGEAAHLDTN